MVPQRPIGRRLAALVEASGTSARDERRPHPIRRRWDLHDVITDALSAPTIQAQGREPCAAGECLVLNYVNRTPSYVVTFWVDPATKLIVKATIPVGTWEWFDYGVPNDLKPPI